MDNRIYGYARVSSCEQNEDRQIEALTRFGVPQQNVIIDKFLGHATTGFITKCNNITACPFAGQAVKNGKFLRFINFLYAGATIHGFV